MSPLRSASIDSIDRRFQQPQATTAATTTHLAHIPRADGPHQQHARRHRHLLLLLLLGLLLLGGLLAAGRRGQPLLRRRHHAVLCPPLCPRGGLIGCMGVYLCLFTHLLIDRALILAS